jgi:hypothetical protein
MKGITYGDIMGMESEERGWYVKRLSEQIKRERDAIETAKANIPRARGARKK